MKFEEYPFDVTRLWDVPTSKDIGKRPTRLTNRPKRPPREPKVVAFPRSQVLSRTDPAACLRQTKAELAEIGVSLKFRDVVRRNGLADRCFQCGRCPEITG